MLLPFFLIPPGELRAIVIASFIALCFGLVAFDGGGGDGHLPRGGAKHR
jgi:hypothetical protein